MQPNRFGRILGVGTRVAAEKLRDGTAGAVAAVQRSNAGTATASSAPPRRTAATVNSSPPSQPKPTAGATAPPKPSVSSSAALADGSRRFARGAGRFSSSLLRPFAHATGLLVLQITGVFFALFTFVFVVHSWQLYRIAGWGDHHLPMYLVFAALFAWFAVSSFWRANRRQKH